MSGDDINSIYAKYFSGSKAEDEPSDFEKRWSKDVYKQGYMFVPSILIRYQGLLGLTDGELVVLLELMTFINSDMGIFPSIKTLSEYGHRSYSATQRKLVRLEKKGFIKRAPTLYSTNFYDLDPLIERLKEMARPWTDEEFRKIKQLPSNSNVARS